MRFSKEKERRRSTSRPRQTRITIRLDDGVLAWFRERVHVAGGGNYQTLISLALRDHVERERKAIDAEVRRERAYELARKRALRDLRNSRDLGTHGNITWTRDELHERHPEKKAK